MNEITKELTTALSILSCLSVSGEAVDMMAAAKQKIRSVIAELEMTDKRE